MYAGKQVIIFLALVASVAGLASGSALAQTTQTVPAVFRLGPGTDIGHGILHFDISWESSSGNLQDLAECKIGECVTYPDPSDPWVYPDPAWVTEYPNPTKITVRAVLGEAEDLHKPGQFDDFIVQPAGFSMTQYYWYKCQGTDEVQFPGYSQIIINENVVQVLPNCQPCAQYTITKLGYSAWFIPKKIVTCTYQARGRAKANHRIAGAVSSSAASPSPFKITARQVSNTHGLGEPVFVDLQVTNLSSEPTSIDLGGNDKTNLLVTVTGVGGRLKAVRLPSGGLMGSGKHLLGAHATYTERLILNEWNGFRQLGDYTIHIALVPEFGTEASAPPAADLQLSVGPRNGSKLRATAKALADRAINGDGVAERDAAALALSYVADPIAVPEMARVLAIGSDGETALIVGLARLGGPSALSALKSAQSSPNEDVRNAANRALRALRDGKPVTPETSD